MSTSKLSQSTEGWVGGKWLFAESPSNLWDAAAPGKAGVSQEAFINPWGVFSIFIAGHALMCLEKR